MKSTAAYFFGMDLFDVGNPGNVFHLKVQQNRPAVYDPVVLDILCQGYGRGVWISR